MGLDGVGVRDGDVLSHRNFLPGPQVLRDVLLAIEDRGVQSARDAENEVSFGGEGSAFDLDELGSGEVGEEGRGEDRSGDGRGLVAGMDEAAE